MGAECCRITNNNEQEIPIGIEFDGTPVKKDYRYIIINKVAKINTSKVK